jgi:hypothetical protein
MANLAIRLARRLGWPGRAPDPAPEPEPAAPEPDPAARVAAALVSLGFDGEAYLTEYPTLGALSVEGCAAHYHGRGRIDRLRATFSLPFGEAVARLDGLDLSTAERDLLRLDLAAAVLWRTDIWGRDAERTADLLAPSPAYRPLAVISDSHGMLYLSEDVLLGGRLLPVPLLCTGASARGLGNPASRVQAGALMRAHLKTVERQLGEDRLGEALVLLKFGQVDLEFVYDYRRVRDGRRAFDLADAEAFARDSARRYAAFVRDLASETPLKLVVTAALPPALNDAALREGYMNAHIVEMHAEIGPEALRDELQKLEMPDWRVRTDLARTYNRELAAACAEYGLIFFDDFTPLIGPDGLIDPELLIWHGGTDHHLCATSVAGRRAASVFAADLAKL